jgi:hypothetical protein
MMVRDFLATLGFINPKPVRSCKPNVGITVSRLGRNEWDLNRRLARKGSGKTAVIGF